MFAMICAAAVAVAAPAPASAPAAPATVAIERALQVSAAGWNAGDLDRFMAVYAGDAMYVTAKGVVRGKADIAAQYRPAFANGTNLRGKLSFQMLAWRTISAVHQLTVARWTLTPADPAAARQSGLTTLLFERRPEGWRIISDHSS